MRNATKKEKVRRVLEHLFEPGAPLDCKEQKMLLEMSVEAILKIFTEKKK